MTARATRFTIGSVLWIGVFAAVWFSYQSAKSKAESPAAKAPSDPMPPMELPEFELTDSRGNKVTREDLVGKPCVLSFVFTKCTTTCRDIAMGVKKLHDRLGDRDVRFVTITVDPEYDTPEQLTKFATIYDADLDRWSFLTGSKETIYSIVNDGLHLYAEEMFGEDRKPGLEVIHTNRVVLLNEKGIPVKTYVGTVDVDMLKLEKVLRGTKPFPKQGEVK